jgi:Holliday junction resolvase RusA-like endonuclease
MPVTRKDGSHTVHLAHDNAALKPWAQAVAGAAILARAQSDRLDSPWRGVPIRVACRFYLPRVKADWGTGRNALKLKPSAATHHIRKPDVDKLVRGVLDALTGVLYGDDGQVVSAPAEKVLCGPGESPRAEIEVEILGAPDGQVALGEFPIVTDERMPRGEIGVATALDIERLFE